MYIHLYWVHTQEAAIVEWADELKGTAKFSIKVFKHGSKNNIKFKIRKAQVRIAGKN